MVEASVGRTVTYSATVTQPFTPVASNTLAGTVTHRGAAEVGIGDELYSINGTAVRVVAGSVPFWRDLAVGTTGPDVAQLEMALVALGHLSTADERFTGATARAVKAWQKSAGHPQTGIVAHGEIVAVPALPTTVKLADTVQVGLVLTSGEPAVFARQAAPVFELAVMAEQASQIPPGAKISVTFQDATWSAVVGETRIDESGTYRLTLTSPDGGPVCGQDCALLPADETVSLMADIELVPSATGPGVPAAAIRTDVNGDTFAVRADGTDAPVTVTASGDGIAIIDGLDIGDTILLPDDADPAGGGAAHASTPEDDGGQ